jgi:hypothetical protein
MGTLITSIHYKSKDLKKEKDSAKSGNPSVTRRTIVDQAGMLPKLYQVHIRKLWVTFFAAPLRLNNGSFL